jgi:multidrug resistance efflux pump
VTRRFVAAPHDGLFEKSLVKPGDVVRRDQVLGRLDGREVRWEMAGLAADEARAAKSRDVNMAANKVAAAQIDALEMERLSHKRRLLEYRADHLDIKSPIDGVIISGDLQRSEGVPVSVGQALYEIAPLDRMVAEIGIPDEERSYVAEGQNVTIRLDAYPGMSWAGRLARINPRSEERDDDNVFIGEVELDSADGLLRPGMKGRSTIDGPRHPLVWLLLRTPWNAVLRWMGW